MKNWKCVILESLNRATYRNHKMTNPTVNEIKSFKWESHQNGTMVQVSAVTEEGGFLYVSSPYSKRDIISAEGVTLDEAVCEALLQVGMSYDQAFDIAISAFAVWA